MIRLWTDGACTRNGRRGARGGWAFIAESSGHVLYEASSYDHERATNNRMELTAILKALGWVRSYGGSAKPPAVEIVTDSKYCLRGATEWMAGWKRRGWQRRVDGSYEPVKNSDLWQGLDAIIADVNPTWRWVPGHDGEDFNERADKLATDACRHGTVLRQPKR